MEKKPNRLYKSRLFVMIFEDKKNLLELYNAVSGKQYKDPELLEISTLENAIYMSMRNDLSFLIDARLSLYGHQSTYSPNLPPRFLVFYNGGEEQPDRRVLRLSDLYAVEEREPKLELEVLMLNINAGHNPDLMRASHTLWEYAQYTSRVRKYAKEMPIAEAVERAITESIREGILKEFLEKHRTEARNMSIYEYDEEKHMRQEREAAWEDGRKEGRKSGFAEGEKSGKEKKLKDQIQKKLLKGKSVSEIADALEEDESEIIKLLNEINMQADIKNVGRYRK